MINETIITTPNVTNSQAFKRISWTAIFIGAIVGIGISFLLGLFGASIGLSIFSMGANGALTLAVGGLIGIIVSIMVGMLAAGYAAGYLGRLYCPQRNLGILYGFCAWTVALMLSALLTTQMSSYVATYANTTSPQATDSAPEASLMPQAEPTKNSTSLSDISVNTSSTTSIKAESPLTVQTASPSANGNQVITVNAAPTVLAWGAFIIFCLFFLGALFCCLGACWGMSCKRED